MFNKLMREATKPEQIGLLIDGDRTKSAQSKDAAFTEGFTLVRREGPDSAGDGCPALTI